MGHDFKRALNMDFSSKRRNSYNCILAAGWTRWTDRVHAPGCCDLGTPGKCDFRAISGIWWSCGGVSVAKSTSGGIRKLRKSLHRIRHGSGPSLMVVECQWSQVKCFQLKMHSVLYTHRAAIVCIVSFCLASEPPPYSRASME